MTGGLSVAGRHLFEVAADLMMGGNDTASVSTVMMLGLKSCPYMHKAECFLLTCKS